MNDQDEWADRLAEQKAQAAAGINCVTCNRCGWVHFAVTREYAELEVKTFNEFYDNANAETKEMYGNHRSEVKSYEDCFRCGNSYKDFRTAQPEDCPLGCTLNPIMRSQD